MNLRGWALFQGIHPQTACKWYRAGTSPVPARKVGQLILVGYLESPPSVSNSAVTYARVSSADQKSNLDRQVARVLTSATEHGYSIDCVVTEVGSAFGGHRRKFLSLLNDPQVTTILEACTNVVYEPTSKPLSEPVWVAVDNRLTSRV